VTDASVCVVGSFMMDLVVRAPRRPERGETVVGSRFETFLGGKGFNQAIAAARSGAPTAMVGRLGDDDFGRRFLDMLATEGIDATNVGLDGDDGTGVGLPLVEDSGENSIVIVPRANHRITVRELDAARSTIEAAAVLLLQLELPSEVVVAAARIGKEAGTRVVLNPAPAVVELDAFAGLVDYVVPNETEAAALTGCETDEGAAERVRDITGASGVILTLGERGALVVDAAGATAIPGHDVPCIDTVGAGDAFCGGFAARLGEQVGLVDAARYGNAAGALAIGRAGAEPSMPQRAEVERLLAEAVSRA
jgi:ribokinase